MVQQQAQQQHPQMPPPHNIPHTESMDSIPSSLPSRDDNDGNDDGNPQVTRNDRNEEVDDDNRGDNRSVGEQQQQQQQRQLNHSVSITTNEGDDESMPGQATGEYISPSSSTSRSEEAHLVARMMHSAKSSTQKHPGQQQQPQPQHHRTGSSSNPLPTKNAAAATTLATATASTPHHHRRNTPSIGEHRRTLSSDLGTIGSDSVPPQKPPHPFFNASFYAEDGEYSDNSIVYNSKAPSRPAPAPAGTSASSTTPSDTIPKLVTSSLSPLGMVAQVPNNSNNNSNSNNTVAATPLRANRDRFPSFDSVGSSSSIRYVPPNSGPGMGGNSTNNTNSNAAGSNPRPQAQSQPPINPRMLPYHERRKLMQQRQQQQQQQDPKTGGPPRPERAIPANQAYTPAGPTPPSAAAPPAPPMPSDMLYYGQVPPPPHMLQHMMMTPPPPPPPSSSSQRQQQQQQYMFHAAMQQQHFAQQGAAAAAGIPPHNAVSSIPPPFYGYPPPRMPPPGNMPMPPPPIGSSNNNAGVVAVGGGYPYPPIMGMMGAIGSPLPPPPHHHMGMYGPPPPPHMSFPLMTPQQQQHIMMMMQQQQQQKQEQDHANRDTRSSSANTSNNSSADVRPPTAGLTSSRTRSSGLPAQQQQQLQRPPVQPMVIPMVRSSGSSSDPKNWSIDSSSDELLGGGDPPQPLGTVPPPRPQRRKDIPPPPPPPPPPPVLSHVRQDSMGSVSSLGSSRDEDDVAVTNSSSGRRNGSNQQQQQQQQQAPSAPMGARNNQTQNQPRQHAPLSSSSSLQPIVPSRASRGGHHPQHPQQHERMPSLDDPQVTEFHRKNQAFLSTVERFNNQAAGFSPIQTKRRPLASMDRPPASRGSHRRLNSIENDDWDEDQREQPRKTKNKHSKDSSLQAAVASSLSRNSRRAQESSSLSSSDLSDDEGDGDDYDRGSNRDLDEEVPTERSKLLPPSGISSNEYHERKEQRKQREPVTSSRSHDAMPSDARIRGSEAIRLLDNAGSSAAAALADTRGHNDGKRKKKKPKHRSSSKRNANRDDGSESSMSSVSIQTEDYKRWSKKRAKILERERAKLIQQWRNEAKAEDDAARQEREDNSWYSRTGRQVESSYRGFTSKAFGYLLWGESFIGNIPLIIGAIAQACANLGVDWFKFTEEMLSSCQPVHFHSRQCTFPEFPGCFYCDTSATPYRIALGFHYACSTFAGILALSFVLKLIIARQVVFDELSSPTTASPAGLICMCLDIVFAGRGFIGMVMVLLASSVHLCLAIWFIYMALAYHIMPEPSWFPNTVGIGISAIKTWLYYPMAGHFLMALSLSLNIFFFPISVIRVAFNRKISATVAWMQMSAPNISLYTLTLMAQPSFEEEQPDINKFQKVHRQIYLPCMHFLFALCIIGMIASVTSLIVRWKEFRKIPFSPAHAAFCAPTLNHANAIQSYRAALDTFSDLAPGSLYKRCVFIYWMIWLVGGTIVTVIITSKFLYHLSEWTHIDTSDEIEPPAPYETSMTLTNMVSTGETLVQSFVSPAILQANETGALVVSRDEQGNQQYRRTRKVTALGFEPMMNIIEMERERELLLDYVGKNPPRRRHRTLSVPGIDFSYGSQYIGTGNLGVYGAAAATATAHHQHHYPPSPTHPLSAAGTTTASTGQQGRRQRANTSSPYIDRRSHFYTP